MFWLKSIVERAAGLIRIQEEVTLIIFFAALKSTQIIWGVVILDTDFKSTFQILQYVRLKRNYFIVRSVSSSEIISSC